MIESLFVSMKTIVHILKILSEIAVNLRCCIRRITFTIIADVLTILILFSPSNTLISRRTRWSINDGPEIFINAPSGIHLTSMSIRTVKPDEQSNCCVLL